MAKATHDFVPAEPVETKMVVTLTLTPEEATVLRSLTSHVGGGGPTRTATASIGKALHKLGYQWDRDLFYGSLNASQEKSHYE